MKDTDKGALAITACAFLWSTAGIFIKLVSWNPLAIAGMRSTIAAIFILAAVRKPRFTFSFPQVAAAVCNAATMLLFVAANKLTTSANAILLQYSAPVFTAFFGWLILREKPYPESWIALVFTVCGMVLFFFDKLATGHLPGDILAIASGITFSLFYIFMRMQKDGSTTESLLLSHGITAVIGLPFVALSSFPTLQEAGVLLALGVLQIGFASLFFAYGIKRTRALQAILISIVEPLANPVWVLIFTGERPGAWALAGGTILIVAVTISSIVTARRIQPEPCHSL